MKKKKILIICMVILGTFLPFSNNETEAYVLMTNAECPRFSDPTDLFYWIDPSFLNYSGKTTEVNESILKWNSLPEIQFTKKTPYPGGADVTVEYIDRYSGDTYAKYVIGSRGSVIVYKKWRELNEKQERETIVHEIGHAIGLHHTQKSNDTISVMRQYGFNNKDYPLSDDKSGVAKRY